jgi:hypothetical protein
MDQLRQLQALSNAAMGDPNSRAQQDMRTIQQMQRGQISSNIAGVNRPGAGSAQQQMQMQQLLSDQQYGLDSRSLMSREQQDAQRALMTELGYTRDQDINEAEGRQQYLANVQKLADAGQMFGDSRTFKLAQELRDYNLDQLRAAAGLDIQNRQYANQQADRFIEAGGTVAAQLAAMEKKGTKG